MKKFSALAVAAALLACVNSAQAEDVAQTQLSALGLGGLEVMTASEGLEVRGKSSSAQASGLSQFSFILFDPQTGNQVSGSGNQFGFATAENAGLQILSTATSGPAGQTVGLVTPVSLDVTLPSQFSATLSAFSLSGLGSLAAGQ